MASSPSCHARKCSLTRSCCNGFRYYGLKRECQANPDTLTVYIDEIDLDRLVDGGKNMRSAKTLQLYIRSFIRGNISFFSGGSSEKRLDSIVVTQIKEISVPR